MERSGVIAGQDNGAGDSSDLRPIQRFGKKFVHCFTLPVAKVFFSHTNKVGLDGVALQNTPRSLSGYPPLFVLCVDVLAPPQKPRNALPH